MLQSELLKDISHFKSFQEAVLALWQLHHTRSGRLCRELQKKLDHDNLSRDQLKQQLKWLVQHSHSSLHLHWVSLFWIGWNK